MAAEAFEAAAAVALKALCRWEDMPLGRKEGRRTGADPLPGEAGVELDVLGGPLYMLKGPAALATWYVWSEVA